MSDKDRYGQGIEGIRIVKRAEQAPAEVVPLTKRDERLAARERQRQARHAKRQH